MGVGEKSERVTWCEQVGLWRVSGSPQVHARSRFRVMWPHFGTTNANVTRTQQVIYSQYNPRPVSYFQWLKSPRGCSFR